MYFCTSMHSFRSFDDFVSDGLIEYLDVNEENDCMIAMSEEDIKECVVAWCGVVWCGVVWCGVVWCGVVWCGVVWCGVV